MRCLFIIALLVFAYGCQHPEEFSFTDQLEELKGISIEDSLSLVIPIRGCYGCVIKSVDFAIEHDIPVILIAGGHKEMVAYKNEANHSKMNVLG